jgi:hypothetical protein
MDETPNTPESLREHFSRRASAARIALLKLKGRTPTPKPSPDAPMTGPTKKSDA